MHKDEITEGIDLSVFNSIRKRNRLNDFVIYGGAAGAGRTANWVKQFLENEDKIIIAGQRPGLGKSFMFIQEPIKRAERIIKSNLEMWQDELMLNELKEPKRTRISFGFANVTPKKKKRK